MSVILLSSTTALAQTRPFAFTPVPSEQKQPRAVLFGDVGFAHRAFASLGPESLEQRLGMQAPLGVRTRVEALVGWASTASGIDRRLSAQVEILHDLTAPSRRAIFALGVGAGQEYTRRGLVTARAVAGYRFARTLAVGSLRLERALAAPGTSTEHRDALDVITTAGVLREIGGGLRLGIEGVGQDLEGFVDAAEAEGGAKLMLGPTIGYAPTNRAWMASVTAGPALQLTRSAVDGSASGAIRDVTRSQGFVIRTSFGYRW